MREEGLQQGRELKTLWSPDRKQNGDFGEEEVKEWCGGMERGPVCDQTVGRTCVCVWEKERRTEVGVEEVQGTPTTHRSHTDYLL